MWIFSILVGILSGAYLYLRSLFKKKVRDNSKLVITERKEVTKEIYLDTLEEIKKTIPVFIFSNGEVKDKEEGVEVEEGEEVDLRRPFLITEGLFEIAYKGKGICKKGMGDLVFYTLNKHKGKTSISCRCLERGRILFMDPPNGYVLFSMLRKKCIEVTSRYFKFVGMFVEKEKMLEEIGVDQEKIHRRICRLLGVNDCEDFTVRVLHKGEVLKKKGACFDSLVYIHYGGLTVKIDGGPEIHFGPGRVFGYFNLFFNIYSPLEIEAHGKTRISLYGFNSLKKNGFDEEFFRHDLLGSLSDFVHLVDVCCDWRIFKPGTVLYKEGEVPDVIYYLSEGKCKAKDKTKAKTKDKEFLSGMSIACQECLLRIPVEERIYSTKVSDVIKIPRGLIEQAIKEISFTDTAKILYNSSKESSGSIITILPADKETNVLLFTRRLKASIGNNCLLLASKDVTEILSKKVFTISEELRLVDYLRRMAKSYPVVIVYIENEYSRFLRYLLKYSDSCLITGNYPTDRCLSMERYCDLEYVRLYEKEQMAMTRINRTQDRIEINRVHHVLSPSRTILFDNKDFERLGRFLLGKRIGLVLSGGGARGIAHIGIIQALEEEGIPIDIIGGTSMGAFVGALYARDCDNGQVFRETKKFCNKAKSIWPYLFDLTYPICSIFTGRAINDNLQEIFKAQNIQDLWIEYFCLTTNLFTNDEEVHRSGLLWRYVRASMGICGYLPPVCDPRGFLVDGGYMNNVPADVMLNMGVSLVMAVDIGTVMNNDYDYYEDNFSGFLAFFHRYFGTRKYLTMEEIQYRIAFLTTEKKMKEVENNSKVLMIRPDLGDIKTNEFNRFDEIVATGYQSAKEKIKEWKESGLYDKYFLNRDIKKSRRRYSV